MTEVCPRCNAELLVIEVKYPCRDTDTANCPVCNTVIYSWDGSTDGYDIRLLNKIHDLKTWKEFFDAILSGEKTFEVGKNDRDFKVGEYLNLIEIDPENRMKATGRTCTRKISYILVGEQWGIMEGYAVLGIKQLVKI